MGQQGDRDEPGGAADPSAALGRAKAVRRRGLGDFTADPRTLVLAAMAICVGTLGAGTAWLLVKLIALVTNLVWFARLGDGGLTLAHAARTPWMVAAPALGGLVIGLMARYGSPKIRGHGIPEAIETILLGKSRIGPKVAILKPLSAAISIGTGGPFGAEGPIIMTGGAIGSLFSQFFSLSASERKALLVAGAAAGMTAIFGTPIAAVLLAVELLLFEWKPRSFIPVATAAIVAIAWRPWLFGPTPLFPFAGARSLPWWGFLDACGVGLLAGLLSGALTLALYKAEDTFEKLPMHWMWWPAIGGLVVGLGGLVEPRALGVGYDVIADLLNDRLALSAVLLILGVKAAIWLVALASGTSGGVLAPLLIFGGALGWIVGLYLPGDPGFWALLGMASMLGGTMRAPITGTIFAVELTGSLHGLAILLCGAVSAYTVTVLLLKRSILTEKIARRGHHITREYTIDTHELARAGEIMVSEVETLPSTMTLADAAALFMSAQNRHLGYPVVDGARRVLGVATRAEALVWLSEIDGVECKGETLADRLADLETPLVHPQDVVGHVVDLMIAEDKGLIPVVDPGTDALCGVITRKDLLVLRREAGLLESQRTRYFARRLAKRRSAPV